MQTKSSAGKSNIMGRLVDEIVTNVSGQFRGSAPALGQTKEHTEEQTVKRTHNQTLNRMDSQTDKQTDKQTNNQTNGQPDAQSISLRDTVKNSLKNRQANTSRNSPKDSLQNRTFRKRTFWPQWTDRRRRLPTLRKDRALFWLL